MLRDKMERWKDKWKDAFDVKNKNLCNSLK